MADEDTVFSRRALFVSARFAEIRQYSNNMRVVKFVASMRRGLYKDSLISVALLFLLLDWASEGDEDEDLDSS